MSIGGEVETTRVLVQRAGDQRAGSFDALNG
jgi:hypothetical protein